VIEVVKLVSVSLIVTTYNWPEALEAVIRSAVVQSLCPNQIIIADDGSSDATKKLIDLLCRETDFPIVHCWQEDRGFRAAASRNRAIAKVTSEYVIIIDGDIVLPPTFVEDHVTAARKGYFIQGGRVMLSQQRTIDILKQKQQPKLFDKGLKNRKNLLRNHLLSKLFSTIRNNANSTRSCNMSFWMDDIVSVNGFDNRFVGWGKEDNELALRLLNFGLNRLYLKFAGAGIHLYHTKNSRESLLGNERILQKTIAEKLAHCEDGLSKFLDH
jgi:glycosyltransferase involved in cell wall biosynthesis